MNGLMMHCNLNITSIMHHAMRLHAEQEIVTLKSDGLNTHRYTYHDAFQRVAQFAHVLDQLQISPHAKIGTLAWNSYQHMELHYAIPCSGRIYHTINPKLLVEQIQHIICDAQNEILVIEAENIPIVEALYLKFSAFLKHVIVLGDIDESLTASFPFQFYEALIQDQPTDYPWPNLPETQASGLCYTSGTTGQPKGVLYSHRSTVLHALSMSMVEMVGLHSSSVMMPMVPLYHISAWDMPFNAVLCGAKLVWPNQFAGQTEKMISLMQNERVDISMAVPTIWNAVKNHLIQHPQLRLDLKRAISGGSAAPLNLIQSMQALGILLENAWGMTETSSLGTINRIELISEDFEHQAIKCGRPIFGLQMRLKNDRGEILPHDGIQEGMLEIRGHSIVQQYIHSDTTTEINPVEQTEASWFDTGDIARIDAKGFMHITDRAKDLIKSGGEWISSVDVENAAMGYHKVHEAAVIAVPHPKWGERPILILILKDHQTVSHEEVSQYLTSHLRKWELPSATIVVNEIPHTATGKISKKTLREKYHSYFQQMDAV